LGFEPRIYGYAKRQQKDFGRLACGAGDLGFKSPRARHINI